jgi:hypothetical protein
MIYLLDHIEHASDLLGPVTQAFKVAQFIYNLTRSSRQSAEVAVQVREYRQELAAYRDQVHRLLITVDEARSRTLTNLDFLQAERDFFSAQIEIARQIMENRAYEAKTQQRAAHVILDLQSIVVRRFNRSLVENDSSPILMIDLLPSIKGTYG